MGISKKWYKMLRAISVFLLVNWYVPKVENGGLRVEGEVFGAIFLVHTLYFFKLFLRPEHTGDSVEEPDILLDFGGFFISHDKAFIMVSFQKL
jgi:hypothetical protein